MVVFSCALLKALLWSLLRCALQGENPRYDLQWLDPETTALKHRQVLFSENLYRSSCVAMAVDGVGAGLLQVIGCVVFFLLLSHLLLFWQCADAKCN